MGNSFYIFVDGGDHTAYKFLHQHITEPRYQQNAVHILIGLTVNLKKEKSQVKILI